VAWGAAWQAWPAWEQVSAASVAGITSRRHAPQGSSRLEAGHRGGGGEGDTRPTPLFPAKRLGLEPGCRLYSLTKPGCRLYSLTKPGCRLYSLTKPGCRLYSLTKPGCRLYSLTLRADMGIDGERSMQGGGRFMRAGPPHGQQAAWEPWRTRGDEMRRGMRRARRAGIMSAGERGEPRGDHEGS